MGMKNKVFGFLAAVGLSISIVAGAAAAPNANTSATVSAQGTACSISVSSPAISFGSWQYNGTGYVLNSAPSSNVNSLSWEIVAGNPGGCTTSLTFAGLGSATTNTDIGLENFSGFIAVVGGSGVSAGTLDGSFLDPATQQSYVLPSATVIGNIQLDSMPNTTMPGWYTGTIQATVINAQ